MKPVSLLLMLAVGWLGAGCFGLKPARDTTYYLLLSAPESGSRRSASAEPAGEVPAWGLAPVGLPAYLDGPWLAVRHGENEIRYSATHRWGERLEQGVRRVLAMHLGRHLAPVRVEARTWLPKAVSWELTVEFQHCEVADDGRVWVEGQWRVNRPLSTEVFRQGAHRIETRGPRPNADPAGAAAALSEALAVFASEMAGRLQITDG